MMDIEAMKPKVTKARERELLVYQIGLSKMKDQFDAVSLINVLSHVQDFHAVLAGRDFC